MAPQITLYSHPGSPNPVKIAILLEALKVDYEVVNREFGNDGPNGLRSKAFLEINPTGRIPAIVDNEKDGHIVWESAAILNYIADRFDTIGDYSGTTTQERSTILQWISYQVSTLGPTLGESLHYLFRHPVKDLDNSVYQRNKTELAGILSLLDKQLENREWIALNRFTLADMAFVPQLAYMTLYDGITLDGYANLQAWVSRVKAIPSVKQAYLHFPRQNKP
ncbi:hypothetical protein M422DRAFT_37522 [Sphaerobolus stellatus SS14]|uniref:Glutathione transferase n=1 Tax=Sphaerobolus stellatus (strain SS14) TaxID=990650 RepID=A0A0C9UG38_SPHS4|nr:hypothetical protein M422DRAFT_37522 [Sphaerobolus stellatus SS14]